MIYWPTQNKEPPEISVNAWGSYGGFGEYTSDSRSVDTYVSDTGDLVPVFSVGDQGQSGNIAPLLLQRTLFL